MTGCKVIDRDGGFGPPLFFILENRMETTLREKTEQVITPLKAELLWFVILLLAIAAGIYGSQVAYRAGFRDGVIAEKIGFLEDADIAREDMRHGP